MNIVAQGTGNLIYFLNRGDVNRGDGEFDIYTNKKNKMAYLRKNA